MTAERTIVSDAERDQVSLGGQNTGRDSLITLSKHKYTTGNHILTQKNARAPGGPEGGV